MLKLTWLQRYQIKHYVADSIWIAPLLSMVGAMAISRKVQLLDYLIGSKSIDPNTARAVLGTMASAMFSFIVFVCSALLVAVQLASAQLTPRIIAVVVNNQGTRISLSVFVFTFTFSLAALVRVGDTVPLLNAYIATFSSLASLCYFLYPSTRSARPFVPAEPCEPSPSRKRR
jgi:uncharacterized membrane protein